MVIEDTYAFSTYSGTDVEAGLLSEMSDLFSAHYGVWDDEYSQRTGNVQLSPKRIKEGYLTDNSQVVVARERKSNCLVGYAVAIRKMHEGKIASWVTQFVVHEAHRQQGIGKNLLYSFWGESHLDAWGIVTSNPYAIRALEKATHRRCALKAIHRNCKWLFTFAEQSISYVNQETEIIVDDERSVINTHFFVSHSEIPEKISRISKDAPWVLGTLEPGWEWFAFSFKEQEQFPLSEDEIQSFLSTSDEITKLAYSKMDMRHQAWTQFTKHEIDFILNNVSIPENSAVLDLGCGTGRHGMTLANRGFNVTAVDYNQYGSYAAPNYEFIQADARFCNLPQKYDLVLCLYDVIGSYADESKNEAIIDTITSALTHGGWAVISVMNIDYLMTRQPNIVDVAADYNRLFELRVQDTMQKTGNVFNNSGILIDEKTHICYRREAFGGNEQMLPSEYIVRDRRYTKDEMTAIIEKHGLIVHQCKYVKAGDWSGQYTASEAKEILFFCQMPRLDRMA